MLFQHIDYGQVFFVVGLVTGLQWRRQSSLELARPLPWLAAFGLIHGGHEWFEMFQIFAAERGVAASGAPVELLRVILLVASFLCLLTFGARLEWPVPSGRWVITVRPAFLGKLALALGLGCLLAMAKVVTPVHATSPAGLRAKRQRHWAARRHCFGHGVGIGLAQVMASYNADDMILDPDTTATITSWLRTRLSFGF